MSNCLRVAPLVHFPRFTSNCCENSFPPPLWSSQIDWYPLPIFPFGLQKCLFLGTIRIFDNFGLHSVRGLVKYMYFLSDGIRFSWNYQSLCLCTACWCCNRALPWGKAFFSFRHFFIALILRIGTSFVNILHYTNPLIFPHSLHLNCASPSHQCEKTSCRVTEFWSSGDNGKEPGGWVTIPSETTFTPPLTPGCELLTPSTLSRTPNRQKIYDGFVTQKCAKTRRKSSSPGKKSGFARCSTSLRLIWLKNPVRVYVSVSDPDKSEHPWEPHRLGCWNRFGGSETESLGRKSLRITPTHTKFRSWNNVFFVGTQAKPPSLLKRISVGTTAVPTKFFVGDTLTFVYKIPKITGSCLQSVGVRASSRKSVRFFFKKK